MPEILPPRLQGTVRVGQDRLIGFAEFGAPHGPAVVWLPGTPGGRRQVPPEARVFALEKGIRIIGVDRPGMGASTPLVYRHVADFVEDLAVVVDALGVGEFATVGLSGGGPYALAAAARLPGRVRVVGVLGGVAPTKGPDAIGGGLVAVGVRVAPLLAVARVPLGMALSALVRVAKPVASPALDLYGRLSPPGDRRLLARPELKAMFLDDLLHGGRRRMSAPLADVILFTRDWGFDLADVGAPVVWWHGDADHVIPLSHGRHMVERLPHATLRTLPGESHLGGLGVPEEILTTLLDAWDPIGRAIARSASATPT